jgi:hypothetical protein
MTAPTYTLKWPRPLFTWEAKRVAALDDLVLADAIKLLVDEALAGNEVLDDLRDLTNLPPAVWTDTPAVSMRRWLEELLQDNLRLVSRSEPTYFAEREGLVYGDAFAGLTRLVEAVAALVGDMQEHGYFPDALPRNCYDNETDYNVVSRKLRSATKLPIDWPMVRSEEDEIPEGALFTLIEYFHDQAQRPRAVEREHTYCGSHYGRHNVESGGVVYRWRMNGLLEEHKIGYRLGATGLEKGRLIRRFESPISDLADRQVAQREAQPQDQVAYAIREFRSRGAGIIQKRSAIRSLSHTLEPRRTEVREALVKGDESDLFFMVNKFSIRHNKDADRDDYGEEFLDWLFWMHLATIELLERLEARE